MATVYIKDGQEFKSEWALRRAFPDQIFPKLTDEVMAMVGITKEERKDVKTDEQIGAVKSIKLGFKELKAFVVVCKGKRLYDDNAVRINSGSNMSFLSNINSNINHRFYRPCKVFGTVFRAT